MHAIVNRLMLPKEFGGILALLELRHFACQDGEDMPFFDAMMRGEMSTELNASRNELPERHVAGPLVGGAGCVKQSPGFAEMVVLIHNVSTSVGYEHLDFEFRTKYSMVSAMLL
jgi:hypothetical protein